MSDQESMTDQIMLDNIEAVKLSEVYDLSKFDCGDSDLNEFLKQDALIHQNEMIADTSLFIYKNQILGFCSLSADSINLSNEERIENIKDHGYMKRYPQYPAIKLARFARDKKFKGQKIGSEVIIPWVIAYINSLESVAVRFITLDAYPEKIEYYENLAFVRNQHKNYTKQDGAPVSMRFDLKLIEK